MSSVYGANRGIRMTSNRTNKEIVEKRKKALLKVRKFFFHGKTLTFEYGKLVLTLMFGTSNLC